ncbi:hypothetical protein NC651_039881 [Populus alba x Populus x berolinensis]|nr:hypothetical protein NC651_039881 [Populus alba x Populus x berolinensis]
MQEFVNHGAVFFKVYVVGDFVKCVKRKSLPDIKEDKLVTLKGLLLFSQISNLEEKTDCSGGGEFDRVEMPPMDFVEEVAKAMKEETGISLLNYDMIREARDAKRYLIIDINYFPGYEKIPNYESVLTDFLLNSMEKNKSGDVSMEKTDCGGGGEFDKVEMPPVDFVEEVAKAMKEETGISLLNFDIPNYESGLTDFLLNSMEKNKSGDISMEYHVMGIPLVIFFLFAYHVPSLRVHLDWGNDSWVSSKKRVNMLKYCIH